MDCVVSVILPTYSESEELLKAAIESILSQTFSDFELIIIVDNPRHPSLSVLESYADRDDRVVLLRNDENRGLVYSLNRGISAAQGLYICRADADDVSYPNRLEMQLSYLQAHGLDLVGSSMVVMDEDGRDLYEASQMPTSPKAISRALKYNNCMPHPTWLGRREVFAQGYRHIPLCEDYDLLIRSCLVGFSMGNVSSPLVKYRMTAQSVSRRSLRPQYLFQKYITREYRNGSAADIDEAVCYVESKSDDKMEINYNNAHKHFNEAISAAASKHYLNAVLGLCRAVFASREYCGKMFRLAMVGMIARFS